MLNQTYNEEADHEKMKINLYIACRSLEAQNSKVIYNTFVVVKELQNLKQWVTIGETEVIKNNKNPNYSKPTRIEFKFEMKQPLKFEVYGHNSEMKAQFIGELKITVAEIATRKSKSYFGDLKSLNDKICGTIIICAEQQPFCFKYKTLIFICETEYIKNNKSPVWKQIEFQQTQFNGDDDQTPILIQLWDHREKNQDQLLGSTNFTIKELTENKNNNTLLTKIFSNTHKQQVGLLRFDNVEFCSFLDYLKNGLELNLLIAIDFTRSNRLHNSKESLHYMPANGQPSQYLQVINIVGEILLPYDTDKKVSLFGFGCSNKNNANQEYCFNLNGDPKDPEVQGLDGIEKFYRESLPQLIFGSPTHFHFVLQKAMAIAQRSKDEGNKCYQILLILTDGRIGDMEKTKDDIIESSYLPISIIIVGIGNFDFTNMNTLDNNDLSMEGTNGAKAVRDSLCFVPFNQFKSNPSGLSEQVLRELPFQVVEYMKLMNITPTKIKHFNQTQSKNYQISNQTIQTEQ